MKKLFRSVVPLLFTLIAVFTYTSAHAQGRWVKLAPFPEPAEELLGAAAGGKLYVFAGLAPGWKPKSLVYEYDPATDKWAKKKPMARRCWLCPAADFAKSCSARKASSRRNISTTSGSRRSC